MYQGAMRGTGGGAGLIPLKERLLRPCHQSILKWEGVGGTEFHANRKTTNEKSVQD
jgi:hypothetical protein